jgi:hypothetical protein
VREVWKEGRGGRKVVPRVGYNVNRNRTLRATVRADEMNMVVLARMVILRPPFDVGVRQHSQFFEQLDGPVDS